MSPTGLIAIATLVALVAYPVFLLAWVEVMRPIRMRFADEGARLLASPHLDDQQKDLVDMFLDDAFDWKFSIAAFIAFLPMLAIKAVMRVHGSGASLSYPGLQDLLRNPEAEAFLDLHAKCALGSNPFFALLFFIEALVVFLVVAIINRSITHGMQFIERSIAWLAAKGDGNHRHAH